MQFLPPSGVMLGLFLGVSRILQTRPFLILRSPSGVFLGAFEVLHSALNLFV